MTEHLLQARCWLSLTAASPQTRRYQQYCAHCTGREAEAQGSHAFGGSTARAWTLVSVTGLGRSAAARLRCPEWGQEETALRGFKLGPERRRLDCVRKRGRTAQVWAGGLAGTYKGDGLERPRPLDKGGIGQSPASEEGHTAGEVLAFQPLSRFDYN